jgi:hypothetical protein
MNWFIGIDNGASGSIGIINKDRTIIHFSGVPVKETRDYTKEVKYINRVDVSRLSDLILSYIGDCKRSEILLISERPMINPTRFQASIHAARSFEAMMICLESMLLTPIIIDSRIWQHELLPGMKGEAALKQASFDEGIRLFPDQVASIIKHGDADALLIAEYAYRM